MRNLKVILPLLFILAGCSRNDLDQPNENLNDKELSKKSRVNVQAFEQYGIWTTNVPAGQRLTKTFNGELSFNSTPNGNPIIEVDSRAGNRSQYIDGFGYTLTGGSAELIDNMSEGPKSALLNNLFGFTQAGQNKINVIRIAIGSEDLSRNAYTLNDNPPGGIDLAQNNFSLSKDDRKIRVLKRILQINPNIKIIATPWSAPAWMKDNNNLQGGRLKTDSNNGNQIYYESYAIYFRKYVEAMKNQHGIQIWAVTPQNEPQSGNHLPSMIMYDFEHINFIQYHLYNKLSSLSNRPLIIAYDHNPGFESATGMTGVNYVRNLLNNNDLFNKIEGVAWHLYSGSINDLSTIHNEFKDKRNPPIGTFFTEQWLQRKSYFDNGDFMWHINNITIDALNNFSRTVLEWNLASNPNTDIRTSNTPGVACQDCMGAVTIDGSSNYSFNVSYYSIAHVSRFLGDGAQRLFPKPHSVGNIKYAAFVNDKSPYARIMLIANDNDQAKNLNLKYIDYDGNVKYAAITVPAKSAQTYVWKQN